MPWGRVSRPWRICDPLPIDYAVGEDINGVGRVSTRGGYSVRLGVDLRLWGRGFDCGVSFSGFLFWKVGDGRRPVGQGLCSYGSGFPGRPRPGAGPGLSIETTVQGAPKVRGKGTKCDVMEQDGTKMGIKASNHRLGTREGGTGPVWGRVGFPGFLVFLLRSVRISGRP